MKNGWDRGVCFQFKQVNCNLLTRQSPSLASLRVWRLILWPLKLMRIWCLRRERVVQRSFWINSMIKDKISYPKGWAITDMSEKQAAGKLRQSSELRDHEICGPYLFTEKEAGQAQSCPASITQGSENCFSASFPQWPLPWARRWLNWENFLPSSFPKLLNLSLIPTQIAWRGDAERHPGSGCQRAPCPSVPQPLSDP